MILLCGCSAYAPTGHGLVQRPRWEPEPRIPCLNVIYPVTIPKGHALSDLEYLTVLLDGSAISFTSTPVTVLPEMAYRNAPSLLPDLSQHHGHKYYEVNVQWFVAESGCKSFGRRHLPECASPMAIRPIPSAEYQKGWQ